ncbi:MAG: glycosyltransferase family 2 protein [Blastochloris sp.]|nr:glycosyltransferase family 2 protein [Blastochloris sp.]
MSQVSVVVPFYNEEENVTELLREILQCLPEAEVIAVNDGSTDGTLGKLRENGRVRVLDLPRNLGQSAALFQGLHAATGEFCVMLDGDGQNDPADIPLLLKALEDRDFVCGVRRKRQDTWSRRLGSRWANSIRRFVLGDQATDTGCTLKAMRREHVQHLIPFNGMHRYIPALLGGADLRMGEVEVNHRPRRFGVSKYTLGGRALRGIWDLVGVRWYLSRQIHWPRMLKD